MSTFRHQSTWLRGRSKWATAARRVSNCALQLTVRKARLRESMRIAFAKQPSSNPKRKATLGQKVDSRTGVFQVTVKLQVEAFVCVSAFVSVCIVVFVYFFVLVSAVALVSVFMSIFFYLLLPLLLPLSFSSSLCLSLSSLHFE